MTSLRSYFDAVALNPLDLIEEVVSDQGWPFDRQSEEELTARVDGRWCAYRLWFSWRTDPATLQFSCAFDLRVDESRRNEVSLLLALVNERMWLGHFDLWSDAGVLLFHHAILVGDGGVSATQCRELVDIALGECERFYPAFHLVVDDVVPAQDAITNAMVDHVGEA